MELYGYPRHMAKAREAIKRDLRYIDIVIETLDARAPAATRTPEIQDMAWGKAHIIAFNKVDLADVEETELWLAHFNEAGLFCIGTNASSGHGVAELLEGAQRLARSLIMKLREEGRRPRPLRAMVVGIPNVGKSSLINRIAGRAKARVGDRPGTTRAKQWIATGRDFELLDTPGLLWPRLEGPDSVFKLAAVGALAEGSFDVETVAIKLLEILATSSPSHIKSRFELESIPKLGHDLLEAIAKKRGCFRRGGVLDLARAANLVLHDFRDGRLGRITLEPAPRDMIATV